MSGVRFAILCLCAYRITRAITRDKLPLLRRPRERALRRWTAGKATDWRAEFIVCPWCVGVWVAAAMTLVADLVGSVWAPGLTFLAVASAVGMLTTLDPKDDT